MINLFRKEKYNRATIIPTKTNEYNRIIQNKELKLFVL
jgi:hypothetical protein